ncbi:MAG: translation elongation factor Ts [Beijerinckiaceae bacterium]
MANITAAMVKELRETSGAGMMDCKTALTETNGDMQAAIDWLRTKGLSKAAKKSGRIAAEGLIGVWSKGTKAAVVEVNSETDFVARNDHFQGLVKMVAEAAHKVGSDVEKIRAVQAGSTTIGDALNNAIATIGENMTLRRANVIEVTDGVVGSYLHNSVGDGLGKIGVLVGLESTGDKTQLAALGRQVAMHIAATNPVALDLSGIPADVIAREKAILAEKNAGKPANVIEKIAESGIKTYAKENTLLEQAYIHDNGKSVANAVKEAEGKIGAPIKITGFTRYALGEGIEKEESDFAAEVAAQAGVKS